LLKEGGSERKIKMFSQISQKKALADIAENQH